MITLPQVLFFYFAAIILGASFWAMSSRNPVHSVLLVLLMFFHLAGVYLTLNAEFIAAVQMIVYAGAVLVLYLFVIILVNLKAELKGDRFIASFSNGILVALVVFFTLIFGLRFFRLAQVSKLPTSALQPLPNTAQLGKALFTTDLLPFEITGIILLVATIGAMVLARRDQPPQLSQNSAEHLNSQEEAGE